MMIHISGIGARRAIAGVGAASLFGGIVAALIAAPTAAAEVPAQCTASGLANTLSTSTGSAGDYLDSHPGANQAVTAAFNQPRPQAEASLRNYFTANPQEYVDLRGTLTPIGDAQRQCNLKVLPPELESAYQQFVAG